jgi:IS30 family transposase
MRYRHLIQEERYQISALLDAGFSQGAIAAKLSRALRIFIRSGMKELTGL